MTSDRWAEINRVLDAALGLAEAGQLVFLREACKGDEELRSEVESLLAWHNPAQQFLSQPAFELIAEELAGERPSMLGQQYGPYHILSVLGVGGMGEVYKARDTRLNRTVAIKVLPKHLSERTDLRRRLEREARAIASLDHPHICALYDIGQERGVSFLVLQYLEGETLSQRLENGVLPTEHMMRYAIEITEALTQAHRKGVVHRDLKPSNIILTETGAKLIDFGLAKRQVMPPFSGGITVGHMAAKTESITEEGMLLGTLEYMAPEQLEGSEVDPRTDLFALGVVVYEMATGQRAFQAQSKAGLIAAILTAHPPPITTFQPQMPPELEQVVQKCLKKSPQERWQKASDLALQLKRIARTVPVEENFLDPRVDRLRRRSDSRPDRPALPRIPDRKVSRLGTPTPEVRTVRPHKPQARSV